MLGIKGTVSARDEMLLIRALPMFMRVLMRLTFHIEKAMYVWFVWYRHRGILLS